MRQTNRVSSQHATLGLVNQVRKTAGVALLEDLPSGSVRDPDDCVIQRGLAFLGASVQVWRRAIHIEAGPKADLVMSAWGVGCKRLKRGNGNFVRIPLPTVGQNFVCEFDLGQHPELVDLETTAEDIIADFAWRTRAKIQRAQRQLTSV